jgi:cytochrome c biogenesis protein CcmG, thiol:disulfide interchange protein DsbE
VKLFAKIPGITLGGIGWMLVLGFLGYRIAPQVQAAFGAGAGGSEAPGFELHTIHGEPVSLERYRGQVVLLNFWATWCPPCRVEMPAFQRVYEDKREQGFVVLGVSTDRAGVEVVREFLDQRGLTFPVAMATGQVVRDFGGIRALPTSFLIGRDGTIRQEIKGYFAEPALRMAVNRLLEEPPAAPASPGPGGDPRDPASGDTIDLRKIGYSRGAEDAPVRVYEFSDFGCPFCGMFAMGTYPALHEEFVATGKVRWTYVPFVMGMFRNGAESARAAECAAEQERFWEMHDLLYERQNEWKASRGPARLLHGYAVQLGLDEGRFAACYRQDRGAARTAINNRAADALRVRATPSFFINGRLVEGALPEEQFRRLLSSLAEAR